MQWVYIPETEEAGKGHFHFGVSKLCFLSRLSLLKMGSVLQPMICLGMLSSRGILWLFVGACIMRKETCFPHLESVPAQPNYPGAWHPVCLHNTFLDSESPCVLSGIRLAWTSQHPVTLASLYRQVCSKASQEPHLHKWRRQGRSKGCLCSTPTCLGIPGIDKRGFYHFPPYQIHRKLP